MDLGLKGKTAIVTGGCSGLGASITQMLVREGCRTVIGDIVLKDSAKAWIDALNAQGMMVHFVQTDVSVREQTERLFNEANRVFGNVDILINNAGVWPTAYVLDMQVDDFRRTLDINLVGPYMLSQRMLKDCIAQGRKGKIINLVSQAAFHGSTSGHAHYAASKAGLVGFTVSLAREAAPYGVTVNAIAPGIMETPIFKQVLNDPERRSAYEKRIPMGRIAKPEEIASMVIFLAGNQSDYMTGATLDATGGMLMR